jgi:AcrR family transcriptional regulator
MTELAETSAPQAAPVIAPGTGEAVLRAAAGLFAERGYDAVSVREIVQAAGVTKPALYYYFGSKEGVALAIMRNLMQAADSIREEAFRDAAGIREALVRYCREMLVFAARHKPDLAFGFTCWFGRSSVQQLAVKTNEYDCKVNAEWVRFLQGHGLDEKRAGNVVRVFWALLMQELLRVTHCPAWNGEPDRVPETIAGLALDGALAFEAND